MKEDAERTERERRAREAFAKAEQDRKITLAKAEQSQKEENVASQPTAKKPVLIDTTPSSQDGSSNRKDTGKAENNSNATVAANNPANNQGNNFKNSNGDGANNGPNNSANNGTGGSVKDAIDPQCVDAKYFKEHADNCLKTPSKKLDENAFDLIPSPQNIGCVVKESGESLQPKSTIFDITKSKSITLPASSAFIGLNSVEVLESSENPLQQYLIARVAGGYTKDGAATLIIDSQKLTAIVIPEEAWVLKSADGADTILAVKGADHKVRIVESADKVLDQRFKETAVALGSLSSMQVALPVDSAKLIQIPDDETVLGVDSFDGNLILIVGDANHHVKGARLVSAPYDNGKLIAITAPENATFSEVSIHSQDNKNVSMDIVVKLGGDKTAIQQMRCDDITGSAVCSTIEGEKLQKALKPWKIKAKDKDRFVKAIKEPIMAPHPYENFAEKSSAWAAKEGGLKLMALAEDGQLSVKMDEFLLPVGIEDNSCGKLVDAAPIDVNSSGGKDMAVLADNEGKLSITFYPNQNQLQQFVDIPIVKKAAGVLQLNQKSLTEEGEKLSCHWEAFEKMPDSSSKEVSGFSDPESCETDFNIPEPSAPTKTSLLYRVIESILISTAHAETGDRQFVFRVTTTDPDGLKAVAQTEATVSKSVASANSGGSGASGGAEVSGSDAAGNNSGVMVGQLDVLVGTKATVTEGQDSTEQKTDATRSPSVDTASLTPGETSKAVTSATDQGSAPQTTLSGQGGGGCSLIR